MIYTATYIEVQPDYAAQGAAIIERYGKTLEVLQEKHRRNRFVVLEVWESEAAFTAHEGSEATRLFRDELKRIHKSPFDQRVHSGFSIGPSAGSGARLSVVTHVDVPPPRREETEAVLKAVAGEFRQEQGNLRFDILQQTARPNHFTLLEEWRDDNAFAAHEASSATLRFRETLGPMLGALYDERLYGRIY